MIFCLDFRMYLEGAHDPGGVVRSGQMLTYDVLSSCKVGVRNILQGIPLPKRNTEVEALMGQPVTTRNNLSISWQVHYLKALINDSQSCSYLRLSEWRYSCPDLLNEGCILFDLKITHTFFSR